MPIPEFQVKSRLSPSRIIRVNAAKYSTYWDPMSVIRMEDSPKG